MMANRRELLIGIGASVLAVSTGRFARAAAPGSWVLYVSAADCRVCRAWEVDHKDAFARGLQKNGIGFRTNGSVGAFGFQGNTVYFGDVTFNTGDGVVIDSGGVGLSSTYNRYFIGAIEHNGGVGIRDNAGGSQWHIGNSNSNTSGGITFGATLGAGRIPYVEGYLTDTTPLVGNSNKVDITNLAQDIGVSAPAPAVPAQITSRKTVAARRAHIIGTQDSSNRRSHEEICRRPDGPATTGRSSLRRSPARCR